MFDPDNFVESDKFNKFGFIAFGQGPRNCIGIILFIFLIGYYNLNSGMRYAMQTLKIAIISVVKNFKVVPSEESTPEDGLCFSLTKNGFAPGIKFKVEKV